MQFFRRSPHTLMHHLFHFPVDKSMLEMGISTLLCNIGRGLVLLSLPFFLYKIIGYQIWQIVAFFVCWQAAVVLVAPLGGKLVKLLHIKYSIVLHMLISAPFWIILLWQINGDLKHDLLLIFGLGVIKSLFGVPANISTEIFVARHLQKKKRGQTLALFRIAVLLGAALAPLVGTLVTHYQGIEYTALAAGIIFILSGIVLLWTKDEKINLKYSTPQIFKDTNNYKMHRLLIAEYGEVFFESLMLVIWPLFLLWLLESLVMTGGMIAVSSIMAMITTYFVGNKINKDSNTTLDHGIWRAVIINIIRPCISNVAIIAIVDALHTVNSQGIVVSRNAKITKWIGSGDSLERAHIYRLAVDFSYLLSFGLLAVYFYLWDDDSRLGFVIIFALGALGLMLLHFLVKIFPK